MMRNAKAIAAVSALLLAGAAPASAAKISFDFQGGRGTTLTPATLDSTEVAGAPGYEAANWNNLATDWSGNPGAVPNPIRDSTGAAVLVTVSYDSANPYTTGSTNPINPTPDQKMMFGYLDDAANNSGQPYANVGGLSAWLANQGATNYSVVVYIASDDGNTVTGGTKMMGDYFLQNQQADAGATLLTPTVSGQLPSVAFAGFDHLDPAANDNVGNYIVFDGLTADQFTLRGLRFGGSSTTGRAPIAGFQIVAVPEPATAGLLAVGVAGLLARRRRASR